MRQNDNYIGHEQVGSVRFIHTDDETTTVAWYDYHGDSIVSDEWLCSRMAEASGGSWRVAKRTEAGNGHDGAVLQRIATVHLVKQWGCEYSEVLSIHASERGAIEAVRRRIFDAMERPEGAVQRAHRRRVWRARRQATRHARRRTIGIRMWIKYPLRKSQGYPRRAKGELRWTAFDGQDTVIADSFGVFACALQD